MALPIVKYPIEGLVALLFEAYMFGRVESVLLNANELASDWEDPIYDEKTKEAFILFMARKIMDTPLRKNGTVKPCKSFFDGWENGTD